MKMHSAFVYSVLFILAMGTTEICFAQERQMGGVGITVFTDRNFRGKSATYREDVPNLDRLGFNDKISSIRVGRGERWEVCEHANYQGRCVVLSGDEPDLRKNSWNDIISSFRRVGGRPTFPPRPPTESSWYIVLHDQTKYRGNPTNYDGTVSDLGSFDRRAQSVTIVTGVWDLCEGRNFTGRCVRLERSVPDLRSYNLRNRVSSIRLVQPGGTRPPTSDWYIVLFEQPSYRGNPTNYTGTEANVNKRARSVTIGRGIWELCDGRNFTGRCVTLDSSVPELRSYDLRNRVRSLRPVTRQPPR